MAGDSQLAYLLDLQMCQMPSLVLTSLIDVIPLLILLYIHCFCLCAQAPTRSVRLSGSWGARPVLVPLLPLRVGRALSRSPSPWELCLVQCWDVFTTHTTCSNTNNHDSVTAPRPQASFCRAGSWGASLGVGWGWQVRSIRCARDSAR